MRPYHRAQIELTWDTPTQSPSPTSPTLGDVVEVIAPPHAGLIGEIKALIPARGSEPERVRIELQGGRKEVVPITDVILLD